MFFQCFEITGERSPEVTELAAFRFDGRPMEYQLVGDEDRSALCFTVCLRVASVCTFYDCTFTFLFVLATQTAERQAHAYKTCNIVSPLCRSYSSTSLRACRTEFMYGCGARLHPTDFCLLPRSSARASGAPIAIDLPIVIISGTKPQCSIANFLPVLPVPTGISSSIISISFFRRSEGHETHCWQKCWKSDPGDYIGSV